MSNQNKFQKFVGDFGNMSWVVLFVQADIDRVTEAYAEATNRHADKNVAVKQGAQHTAPTGCIVQIRDCEWVIVFHMIGQWEQFDSVGLSNRLDARLLEFSAEDTSGAIDCELYEPKFGVTRYQTAADSDYEEELYEEMDEFAEELGIELSPAKPAAGIESYQALFDSLGISTIQLALGEDGTLVADEEDRQRIVRVDRLSAKT